MALHEDAVIDWLIEWVQFTAAFDHSPALNRPCLRAWTHGWPTFSLFLYQFSLPSSLCYEQNFLFRPVSKTPREVSINLDRPSDTCIGIFVHVSSFSFQNSEMNILKLKCILIWQNTSGFVNGVPPSGILCTTSGLNAIDQRTQCIVLWWSKQSSVKH